VNFLYQKTLVGARVLGQPLQRGIFILNMFGGWDMLRTKFVENVDKVDVVLERVERLLNI
jgi:hypothetical protein